MNCLDFVRLTPLMEITSGRPDIVIGLIDGPVVREHSDISTSHIREIAGKLNSACTRPDSVACQHGTFVASILSAKRNSTAPAICPHCTLLVRPIFAETISSSDDMPSAKPEELADAILDCIRAGAHILNVSASIAQPSFRSEHALEEALDYAMRRGVIVVAAAGNQGTLGSTAITSHPWVIPVVAYDLLGRPMNLSNLGSSIGKQGLGAPGERITSLGVEGKTVTLGGTSVAVPFVTGAIALLWSEFSDITAANLKLAVLQTHQKRRISVVPPLLDAWGSYQYLSSAYRRR